MPLHMARGEACLWLPPSADFQTKGSTNQIYAGLLWNITVDHVWCVFVCNTTVPLCAQWAANPPWSLLRVGPNPTGAVYIFTALFSGSRVRMWPWHADRPNYKSASSHGYNRRHSHQIRCQAQQRGPICPSFIPTKTLPQLPLSYIPKHWLGPLKLESGLAAKYTLPYVTDTSPSPVWPASVGHPAAFGHQLVYPQSKGFHTLPVLFGEHHAPNWPAHSGMSVPCHWSHLPVFNGGNSLQGKTMRITWWSFLINKSNILI